MKFYIFITVRESTVKFTINLQLYSTRGMWQPGASEGAGGGVTLCVCPNKDFTQLKFPK